MFFFFSSFVLGKYPGEEGARGDSGEDGKSEGSSRMKRAPKIVRFFLAEFLGTMLLVVFGDGAIGQYKFLEPGE